jgi:hypothetical protein
MVLSKRGKGEEKIRDGTWDERGSYGGNGDLN